MGSSSRLLSFFFYGFLIHLVNPAIAQRDPYVLHECSTNGNVSSNSAYRANLNTLLSNLSSKSQIDNGFYNYSAGENSDKVNAIALCRGDLTATDCRSCVNMSAHELLVLCPNEKEGIMWYMNCTVRYANNSIFGVMEIEPMTSLMSVANVSEKSGTYKQVLAGLLDGLRSKAASGDSLRKLAIGAANSTYFNLYALLQCTPDLDEQECSNCLNQTIRYLPECCGDTTGARVLTPSCNLRYEDYRFYDNTTAELPSSSYLPPPPPAAAEAVDGIVSDESLQFDFATIRVATENFSEENKLGQGGFGAVYKGMLSNGQEIAVKRLSSASGQGDQEFKNEVLLVAKLQHRNLVRLLGFCLEGNEGLFIYELMPNASLDRFLFDPIKRLHLDWERRYKIIDDSEMNPKIADFGMARLFVLDQTHANTRRIVGTYGYMAPEYAMQGHFSVKTDVFSFGVLVLEMVSGQKNSYFLIGENLEDLLSYAWRNWREGTASNLIDPTLRASSTSEIMRCIHIGLLCVQENVADRPTMASIVFMFNSNSITLSVPSRPAFFMHTTVESDVSSDQSFQASTNEATISELYPR